MLYMGISLDGSFLQARVYGNDDDGLGRLQTGKYIKVAGEDKVKEKGWRSNTTNGSGKEASLLTTRVLIGAVVAVLLAVAEEPPLDAGAVTAGEEAVLCRARASLAPRSKSTARRGTSRHGTARRPRTRET